MMSDPTVAVIAVDPNGFVQALKDLKELSRTSASAFHKKWWKTVSFFHRDGQRYQVANVVPDRPRGFFSHLLAFTVYNPRFAADYSYEPIGPYRLDELQAALKSALNADDDILTQFRSQQELLDLLGKASSFDDVVSFVRYMQVPDDAA